MRPLGEKGAVSAEDWAQLEDDSTKLLSRRDRLIEELRDIEFEAALNKVDPRDLEALRNRYENEAVILMGALEDEVDQYQARIEEDISGMKGGRRTQLKNAVTTETQSDDGREEVGADESLEHLGGGQS